MHIQQAFKLFIEMNSKLHILSTINLCSFFIIKRKKKIRNVSQSIN